MSESITNEQLAAIEAAAKTATPGPWLFAYNKVWSEPRVREYDRLEEAIPADAPEDDPRWDALPETIVATVPPRAGDTPTEQGERDGEFIAALYPERALALVARLRQAEAERDSLRAEVEKLRAENAALRASQPSFGRAVACGADGPVAAEMNPAGTENAIRVLAPRAILREEAT